MVNPIKKSFYRLSSLVAALLIITAPVLAQQQELTSNNYKIVDPTVDSGGGVSESANFGLIASIGDPTADTRLTSGNYAIRTGFPNLLDGTPQADIPGIICAEATTDNSDTDCLDFPGGNGAIGECGTPGCYDRAKIELDPMENPVDTLYLVSITDVSSNIEYYVSSSHTLATTYSPTDYMTICQFQGANPDDVDCTPNDTYRRTNVFGLVPNKTYEVKARALNPDLTDTPYSSGVQFTTAASVILADIDTGTDEEDESVSPYNIGFPSINDSSPTTADKQILLDFETNSANGISSYVQSLNEGLEQGAFIIPSQTEDLAVDTGGDGGYGLKAVNATASGLGPLQYSANYSTAGADEVGSVTSSPKLIFFTDNSGENVGPIVGGRGSVAVKARAGGATPSGGYTDTLTFTLIGNF